MDPRGLWDALTLAWVALTALFIAHLGWQERPTEGNVARALRRVRALARRKPMPPARLVEGLRREMRFVAAFALGFSVFVLGLLVAFAKNSSSVYGSVWLRLGLPWILLLAVLGAAFLYWGLATFRWAPIILERVRLVLESEASTTNEPASLDAPRP